MRIILFFAIATVFISCSFESNYSIPNEPVKEKLKINADTQLNKDSIRIHVARGVMKSKLSEDAVILLTDYLTHYSDFRYSRDLFSLDSKDFVHVPFYSYHLPEFFEKDAFIKYKPTLLAVYTTMNDTVAKVSFSSIDSLNNSNLKAIFNFGLTYSNSNLMLENMVMINSGNWERRKVGAIEYVFPRSHEFSDEAADEMSEFNQELSKLFQIDIISFRYFVCKDNIELERLRGVEYLANMYSMNTSSGLAEPSNNIIYAGNGSEFYPHELVHFYSSRWIHPKRCHEWFDEGLATFLGGSRGMSLEWHLNELAKYTKENTIDFSDVLNCQNQITNNTGLIYVVGGLICKLAYDQGGMQSVKLLFSAGDSDADFYTGVENVLGVKQEDLNHYIRSELEQYSL